LYLYQLIFNLARFFVGAALLAALLAALHNIFILKFNIFLFSTNYLHEIKCVLINYYFLFIFHIIYTVFICVYPFFLFQQFLYSYQNFFSF